MSIEIAYYNGHFIPFDDVKISPNDRGFLFADGAYEVVRSYHSRLFMVKEHLERLTYSLKALRIEIGNIQDFEVILMELLKRNDCLNADCTIYIQVTRGVYKRMLKFPDEEIEPTIYMKVNKIVPDDNAFKKGIKVFTVEDIRWGRCDIKSIGLIANVLAHQEAVDKGGRLGLFVQDGKITEGTHTGVFGVRNGKLITHPANYEILPSITRKVVYQLCEMLNIEIEEAPIQLNSMYRLDELFVVGTTPEITSVIMVDDVMIGNGMPGVITKKLQSTFLRLI